MIAAPRFALAAFAVSASLVSALACGAVRDALIEGALQGGKTWAYATADLVPELMHFTE
jgi:hypothetical protein